MLSDAIRAVFDAVATARSLGTVAAWADVVRAVEALRDAIGVALPIQTSEENRLLLERVVAAADRYEAEAWAVYSPAVEELLELDRIVNGATS